MSTASKDQQSTYIFLDKNYPPAEFVQTLEAIKKFEETCVAVHKIAVVPNIVKKFEAFPFSISFFVQCYLRCLHRSGHLTISNEDPERVVKILMLFFRQFNSIKFDESFLSKGFDSIFPVNLTIEHEDL